MSVNDAEMSALIEFYELYKTHHSIDDDRNKEAAKAIGKKKLVELFVRYYKRDPKPSETAWQLYGGLLSAYRNMDRTFSLAGRHSPFK